MHRSIGVTLSAVLVYFGSGVTLLLGAGMVLALRFAPTAPNAPGLPAGLLHAMLAMIVVMTLGFGAWGIASGVGLIYLRGWARISMLVFSGLMVFFCLPQMLIFPFFPFPNNGNLPANFGLFMKIGMTVYYGLFAALGGFWFFFFNKRTVKDQFRSVQRGAEVIPSAQIQRAPRARVPVPIAVFAWFLIGGGCLALPFVFLMRLPALFLGFALAGRPAIVFYVVFIAWSIASGIGLLRRQPWGWFSAVVLQLLQMLNGLAFVLNPGAAARLFQAIQVQEQVHGVTMPPGAPPFPIWLTLVPALLLGVAVLGILLWYKAAFDGEAEPPEAAA